MDSRELLVDGPEVRAAKARALALAVSPPGSPLPTSARGSSFLQGCDNPQMRNLMEHTSQLMALRQFLHGVFQRLGVDSDVRGVAFPALVIDKERPASEQRAPAESDAFKVFDQLWREDLPMGNFSWVSFRGCLGEAILALLVVIKVREQKHPNRVAACRSIIHGILAAEPMLAQVAAVKEPYCGQTTLHMACADGDLDLVQALVAVKGLDLDVRFTGSFVLEMTSRPAEWSNLDELVTPVRPGKGISLSALEVALVSSIPDDDAIEIMKCLMRADAASVFADTKADGAPQVMYTLLHAIARGRWAEETVQSLVSKSRTRRLLGLLMDPQSEFYQTVNTRELNASGLTALQSACVLGNETYFIEALEWMKVFVWQWGGRREVGFPLGELDSASATEYMCALEYMTMFRRHNLLCLGLISHIIQDKWDRLGNYVLATCFILEVVTTFFCAVVCLDDTEGFHAIRFVSRCICLTLSASFVCFNSILYITCATPVLGCLGFQDTNERWFQMMSWFQRADGRAAVTQLLLVRSVGMMFVMFLLVLSAPWSQTPAHQAWMVAHHVQLAWQVLASAWWLYFPIHMLRYFEFFEATGPLSAAIPVILSQDMAPFLAIYLIIFFCSAVGLRVAASHTSVHTDTLVGSFGNVLKTLEEAIHGPDAQWRRIVQEHPAMAGIVFITFLWITLIMMTVLIAMVSKRYDALLYEIEGRMLYRRALFGITLDKIVPEWVYKRFGVQIGFSVNDVHSPEAQDMIDGAAADRQVASSVDLEECQVEVHNAGAASEVLLAAATAGLDASKHDRMETASLSDESPRNAGGRPKLGCHHRAWVFDHKSDEMKERWFPWKGGEATFDLWKLPRVKETIVWL